MIRVKTREEFLIKASEIVGQKHFAIEIGCYRGDFSEMILKYFKPYHLYLIDSFKNGGKRYGKELNYIQSAYSDYRDYEYVKNKFKNSVSVSIYKGFSFEIVDKCLDIFNLIYHDASHLYEDIKMDLEMWLPKLRPGGLMCGHDYIEHPDFGVIQAVDEFCAEYNFEMIIFNENGGDYALKRCIQ